MKRRHAVLTSLLLGLAVVAGALALTRTMALGQSTGTGEAQIAQRTAALDRAEAQVRRLRAKRPPRLPAASGSAAPETRVVFVRAARAQAGPAEHEDEHEAEAHENGEGGEWDD
jgi:hypothetical protein